MDLIRGISILLVLFHHFNIAYRLDDTVLARIFGWDAVRAFVRNGNYGVTMFFVVSGFLITSNARRRWGSLGQVNAWSFYGLRAARILPCLLLLLFAADALAMTGLQVFQNHLPEDGGSSPVPYWLSHVAALTSWMNVLISRDGWFNYPLGVLWSLSVEEVFYFGFPLACLMLRTERRLAAFCAVFIVIGPIWRFFHQDDEGDYLYAYLACFDGIAIGSCAALLAERITIRGPAGIVFQAAIAAGMAFIYLERSISETNTFGVTLMALGTAILLLGAQGRSIRSTSQHNRIHSIVCWLGKHSYELYLFHLIVLGMLRSMDPPSSVTGDEKLLLLAIYLVFSALLAAQVARLYAEPLNQQIRQRLSMA